MTTTTKPDTTPLAPHWGAAQHLQTHTFDKGPWWRLTECLECSEQRWQFWARERQSSVYHLLRVSDSEAGIRLALHVEQERRVLAGGGGAG